MFLADAASASLPLRFHGVQPTQRTPFLRKGPLRTGVLSLSRDELAQTVPNDEPILTAKRCDIERCQPIDGRGKCFVGPVIQVRDEVLPTSTQDADIKRAVEIAKEWKP